MGSCHKHRVPRLHTILLPPGMVRPPGSFGHPGPSLSPREWKEEELSPTPLQLRCRGQECGVNLILLLICCVTSGKSPNFSELPFPQL